MTLMQNDAVSTFTPTSVKTINGKELEADVVILSTGFKVQDFLFPIVVTNGEGESLLSRLKGNGVRTFQSTCVSGFPNFFL